MSIEKSNKKARTQWFKDAGFGVIIHWGPYSVPAYDDIENAKKRKLQNGSEWYYRRLTAPLNQYAPPGSQETRIYHQTNYPNKKYQDFVSQFTAENWNPEQLASKLVSKGVKYVIITAKHHDGFCMWPNGRRNKKTNTPWNAGDIGPHRDIIGELMTAVRQHDIKFGIYYSLMEWDYPKSKKFDYVQEIVQNDLTDIQTRYKPDVWWFDGDWTRTTDEWKIGPFINRIHKESEIAITNDRLGKQHEKYAGDYQTFKDRYIPKIKLETPWEHVMTSGYSWGFNAQQKDEDFKTQQQLRDIFNKVRSKGGNILLNLGPDSKGDIDEREMNAVEYMGKLFEEEKGVGYELFYDIKEENGFLSNFYQLKRPLLIDNELWKTSEAYYQAMKYRGKNVTEDSIIYSNYIREADSPMKVFMLGRMKPNYHRGKNWKLNKSDPESPLVNDIIEQYKNIVKMREDWKDVYINVMVKAVVTKFVQNPELTEKLFALPDNKLIVEHTIRDKVWADGGDGGTGKIGTNYLGKILTATKYALKYGTCDEMSIELKNKVRIV